MHNLLTWEGLGFVSILFAFIFAYVNNLNWEKVVLFLI